MKKGYWSGAHTRHRLKYHLVWIPKFRKRVLVGKIAIRIKDLLYRACEINRWWIREININKNHIHVVIQIHPNESLSSVVQRLKGGSSRMIRKEYPEIEEFIWGDSFWADGYFAETVGKVSEKKIIEYIREQNESMPQ